MAGDMTYTDLGCYGNVDIKTPHIDRLATQGVRFTQCYNAAPTCSPLRQSLFTGMYPVEVVTFLAVREIEVLRF